MSKYSDITNRHTTEIPRAGVRELKSGGTYLMQRSLVDTSSCRDTEAGTFVLEPCQEHIWMCDWTVHLLGIMLICRCNSCRFWGQTAEMKVRESIPSKLSDMTPCKSRVSRLSVCNVKTVNAALSGRKRLNPRGTKPNSYIYKSPLFSPLETGDWNLH